MLIGIENQAKCFLKREAKKLKHQEKANKKKGRRQVRKKVEKEKISCLAKNDMLLKRDDFQLFFEKIH